MKFSLFSGGRIIEDGTFIEKFQTKEVGVFETLRVYNGRIFRESEHLIRLQESAKTAGWTQPIDSRHLHEELRLAVEHFGQKEAVIRLTLLGNEIFIMIGERKHPKVLYEQGVALRTSPVKRSLSHAAFPEAKTTAYQNAVLASLEPCTQEIYEWVFLDANGYVTEVRIGNLIMVKKSFLLTPPLRGILNGVTRRFVIECALRTGMPVNEVPLTRHDIYNADEAFLTNTTWEILPVRELDGRRIGSTVPGRETLKLHRFFKQRVSEECQSQLSAEP
jgi:branched-chain amino acid aminotransferase